jgi:hypothetical protein
MTGSSVLVLALIIGCGVVFAQFLGKSFGWVGYCIGFPAGLLASFAVLYLLARVEACLLPHLPICRRGRCKYKDYELIEGRRGDPAFVYQCKCGDKYVHIPAEKRCMELFPDGTRHPYKKRGFMGRWKDDT